MTNVQKAENAAREKGAKFLGEATPAPDYLIDSGRVETCPVCKAQVHVWLDGDVKVFDWHDKAVLVPCEGRPERGSMKTFADLKRRMVTGARVVLVWSKFTPHKFQGVERTVSKVQTNGVWFGEGVGASWLQWPKAGEVQVREGGFSILEGGCELLRYEVRS